MASPKRVGATTALWLWHDWKRSRRALGWHRNSIAAEIQALQGYGKTQQPKYRGDPTAAASMTFEIALTVDRIIGQLNERDAQLLILRQVGRLTYEDIGERYGHSRRWASEHCRRVHDKFCDRLGA